MKVTTDPRPDAEVEIERLRDVSMLRPRLPDPARLSEEEARGRGLEAD